jgi:hypothetical protein
MSDVALSLCGRMNARIASRRLTAYGDHLDVAGLELAVPGRTAGLPLRRSAKGASSGGRGREGRPRRPVGETLRQGGAAPLTGGKRLTSVRLSHGRYRVFLRVSYREGRCFLSVRPA